MAAGGIEGVDRRGLSGTIRLGFDEGKTAVVSPAIFIECRFLHSILLGAGKDGKAEADGVWTFQVTDQGGVRRRIPGFASRAASMELERNIRKLVSFFDESA